MGIRAEIVVQGLGRLFREGTLVGLTEGELLSRYARRRDEVAFGALADRHGPMVLGVCRRILDDPDAADDAFQAVFLILARRAGSIRDGNRLGPWLFGVARRVALRARSRDRRRRAIEGPGDTIGRSADGLGAAPGLDPAERSELRSALDAEVARLPSKFRDPVVLCYLEGLTHDEAAARLRIPVGTVRSRMARGRATLRDRLTRRGLGVPAALLAAGLLGNKTRAGAATIAEMGEIGRGLGTLPGWSPTSLSPTVPDALMRTTMEAAAAFAPAGSKSAAFAAGAGLAPTSAGELATGVLHAMNLHKLMIAAGVTLVAGATVGGGLIAGQFGGGSQSVTLGAPGRQGPVVEQDRSERESGFYPLLSDDYVAQVNQAVSLRKMVDHYQRMLTEAEQNVARIEEERRARQDRGGGPASDGLFSPPASGRGTANLEESKPIPGSAGSAWRAGEADFIDVDRLVEIDRILTNTRRYAEIVNAQWGEIADLESEIAKLQGNTEDNRELARRLASEVGKIAAEQQRRIDHLKAELSRLRVSRDQERQERPPADDAEEAPTPVPGASGIPAPGGFGRDGVNSAGENLAPAAGGSGLTDATAIENSVTSTNPRTIIASPRRVEGGGPIWALAASTGEWRRYDVRKGVTATPIYGSDCLALKLEGESVHELVAFDNERGEWYRQVLAEPTDSAVPILGDGLLTYSIGPRVYAYSNQIRRWDVLDLGPNAGLVRPMILPNWVQVEAGGTLHVFNAQTGRWATLDPEAGE